MRRREIMVGSFYKGFSKVVQITGISDDDETIEYLLIKTKNLNKSRVVGEKYKCKMLSFQQNFLTKLGFTLKNEDVWR